MASRRQECTICLESFKNPKLIPCHHSFCFKCLEDYVRANHRNGHFDCPTCRKSVELPPGGVYAFQDNYYIDCESGENFPCDICGPKRVALSRCLDCEENLCQSCCYSHERSKASRHHKISDLGTLETDKKGRIRQRVFCDQHPDDEIKLICKDCKAFICVLCKAGKHDHHATEAVFDVAAEVKKTIQIKINQCSDKVRSITVSEQETEALSRKINDAERKEIKALEDQRLQLIKIIDQEVAKMKEKIQNVYKDLRQQNAALRRVIKEKLKTCSTANEKASKLIDQGTDMDIIKKSPDIEQLLYMAMSETAQNPTTRIEKDLFLPVEIKINEVIRLIGKMQDSNEMSPEERSEQMELSMTTSTRPLVQDKVSIASCNVGDLVLLCLDERHDQYVVFTVGNVLHFLHTDSFDTLGLKMAPSEQRKAWVLAEIIDKEYCQANKDRNRFKVPKGSKFYRVKAKPWSHEPGMRRNLQL